MKHSVDGTFDDGGVGDGANKKISLLLFSTSSSLLPPFPSLALRAAPALVYGGAGGKGRVREHA